VRTLVRVLLYKKEQAKIKNFSRQDRKTSLGKKRKLLLYIRIKKLLFIYTRESKIFSKMQKVFQKVINRENRMLIYKQEMEEKKKLWKRKIYGN